MIIDGKKISNKILEDLKIKYLELVKKKKRKAKLTVILIGNNYASSVYVRNKENVCNKLDIDFEIINLDENVEEEKVIEIIKKLNKDSSVDGILLQLPIPKHLNQIKICSYISEYKDVDGINPINLGELMLGIDGIKPCTAKGVIRLLNEYNIEIKGSNVVIIGRSNIVGKPLSMMLTNMSATVTVCNRQTKNIDDKIKNADIIVTAAGYKNLINKNHELKKGVCLIDVGINRDENNKICGDINFKEIIDNKNIAYITPVPGGVGPMTITMLIENLIELFEKNK